MQTNIDTHTYKFVTYFKQIIQLDLSTVDDIEEY